MTACNFWNLTFLENSKKSEEIVLLNTQKNKGFDNATDQKDMEIYAKRVVILIFNSEDWY